jgi:hypothetical protein
MSRGKSRQENPSDSGNGSAKQLIRKVRQATRRRCSAEEKIRAVMEGIRGDDSVWQGWGGFRRLFPSSSRKRTMTGYRFANFGHRQGIEA